MGFFYQDQATLMLKWLLYSNKSEGLIQVTTQRIKSILQYFGGEVFVSCLHSLTFCFS